MTLSRQRREELFVRAVDGCLSAQDERELEAYLEDHPEARAELDDHQQIKDMTDAVVGRILATASIEPPRPTPATKGVLTVGLVLLLAGAVLLFGYALWGLFVAPETPTAIKAGTVLAGTGGLVLFALVFRSRLRAHGHDPYKEIDR